MKKIAVAALSLMLACSLCPVASFASDAVLQDEGNVQSLAHFHSSIA